MQCKSVMPSRSARRPRRSKHIPSRELRNVEWHVRQAFGGFCGQRCCHRYRPRAEKAIPCTGKSGKRDRRKRRRKRHRKKKEKRKRTRRGAPEEVSAELGFRRRGYDADVGDWGQRFASQQLAVPAYDAPDIRDECSRAAFHRIRQDAFDGIDGQAVLRVGGEPCISRLVHGAEYVVTALALDVQVHGRHRVANADLKVLGKTIDATQPEPRR
eukprot:scaffold58_cov256-Pinguiococcus_pyrenoidosus.AAC.8